MEDNKLTTEELLTLEDRAGEGVHVRPNAFAEFETSIEAALEELVARWLPYASPRAQSRNANDWRR